MSTPNGLDAASGKPALDAMTDQSLAFAREKRHTAHPAILRLAGDAARLIAVQFPGCRDTAGRAVMAVAHVLVGLEQQFDGEDRQLLTEVSDVLALTAEQVVREAGES